MMTELINNEQVLVVCIFGWRVYCSRYIDCCTYCEKSAFTM